MSHGLRRRTVLVLGFALFWVCRGSAAAGEMLEVLGESADFAAVQLRALEVSTDASALGYNSAQHPDDQSFEIPFVPYADSVKLAVFSDDGVTVTIVDQSTDQEHSTNVANFNVPQALPDIPNSLKLVEFSFVAEREYTIRVRYSNTLYTGGGDIDGVILFAFGGAAAVPAQVTIDSIDPHFAPSVERMNLTYSIKPAGSTAGAAKLEIFAAGDAATPIYSDSAISKSGTAVPYKQGGTNGWDGQGTNGWITPQDGPYKIKITIAADATFANPASATATTDVIVHSLDLRPDPDAHVDLADSKKFIMNNPEAGYKFLCEVKLKDKANSGVKTSVPIRVDWWFEDPGDPNTSYEDSYSYAPLKRLGKRDHAGSIYWSSNVLSPGGDFDLEECNSKTVTDPSSSFYSNALVYFHPSGVGGDDFQIRAGIFRRSHELKSSSSGPYVVWRMVEYASRAWEMHDVSHISQNLTTQGLQDFFSSAFVIVKLPTSDGSPVRKISPEFSVPFIGLWRNNPGGMSPSDFQKDWPTLYGKRNREAGVKVKYGPHQGDDLPVNGDEAGQPPSERIPVQERIDAQDGNIPARVRIEKRSQSWCERIDEEFFSSMLAWIDSAKEIDGLTGAIVSTSYEGTIIGINDLHPKYSPDPLGITHEWEDSTTSTPFGWLSIRPRLGTLGPLHPDAQWAQQIALNYVPFAGQMVTHRPLVLITTHVPAGRIMPFVAHETGHLTKRQFQRGEFGGGDHTSILAPDGLMKVNDDNMVNSFSGAERRILRGILP